MTNITNITVSATDIIKILNATGDDVQHNVNYFTIVFSLIFIVFIFAFICFVQKMYNEPCKKRKIYPFDSSNNTETINKYAPHSNILKLKHVNKV